MRNLIDEARICHGPHTTHGKFIQELADYAEDLEAKLATAVEALDKIKRIDNLVGVFAACERTLAELTGGKDE